MREGIAGATCLRAGMRVDVVDVHHIAGSCDQADPPCGSVPNGRTSRTGEERPVTVLKVSLSDRSSDRTDERTHIVTGPAGPVRARAAGVQADGPSVGDVLPADAAIADR